MENRFLGYFAVYAIKFPTKCAFQSCRSKTAGEDTFPAANSLLFRRREKHINMNNMCKIYNVVNNKTADMFLLLHL